ncbi:hypothetical protein [Rhodococcus opacus]|uniref:hypothetical protein n=1 Tax=Rhodococcus opacus TaxID=37919 RepID=UPI000A9302B8|nr:hypothetical protein [Rhodococcus opacus]
MLHSGLSNFFCPQQKSISKIRDGAKGTTKYDAATTPHRRAERHDAVTLEGKAILADIYIGLNPAAIQRQIQAPSTELPTLPRQGRSDPNIRRGGRSYARILE